MKLPSIPKFNLKKIKFPYGKQDSKTKYLKTRKFTKTVNLFQIKNDYQIL